LESASSGWSKRQLGVDLGVLDQPLLHVGRELLALVDIDPVVAD